MNDGELFAFMDTFRSLTRVFYLRGDEHELRDVGASYFRAFKRFDLRSLDAGAEIWIQRGKRFPRPAEWIESIPKQSVVSELLALSESAAAEHVRAESLKWEDGPCKCTPCREENVSDKQLRYVPDIGPNDGDVHALIGERTVTTGHWAHGAELAGYYRGKNAFWAAMFERFGADGPTKKTRVKRTFEEHMKHIYQEPPRV